MPQGGTLAPEVIYLGRSGQTELQGLNTAFLSGIYAPRFFEQPLLVPRTATLAKQAGYFRVNDVTRLERLQRPELMLVHEWPRGLVRRRIGGAALRAHRFPWIGNPVTQSLVRQLQPLWLFCGHSHVPLATTLASEGEHGETKVVCLDQAASPEGAIFWMDWPKGEAEPQEAGWGITGEANWRSGEPWDESCTPAG
jgi:lariat debranching enzyme